MKNNQTSIRSKIRPEILYVWTWILFVCAWISACVPPEIKDYSITHYSLQDPEVQKIINLQDARLTDSLYGFLQDNRAHIRLLAVRGLGNCKDSNAIERIAGLLKDPIEAVRRQAAFSLGLIGHPKAESPLIQAFIPVDSAGPFLQTNAVILEALGRCGTDSTLRLLCKVKTYKQARPSYLHGWVSAWYRFGLRGKFCAESTQSLVEISVDPKIPDSTRILAAHSLMRFKEHDTKPYFNQLKEACYQEKDPDIRLCLIQTFARIGSQSVLTEMEELYRRGLDVRVQTSLVKGLQYFQDGRGYALALKAIQNPSIQVAIQGAQYFLDHGKEIHEDALGALIEQGGLSWIVKSMIYESLLKITPAYKVLTKSGLIYQVKSQIQQSKNPYEKAAYIRALAGEFKELPYLLTLGSGSQAEVVHTTLTETILKMVKRSVFQLTYPGPKNSIYKNVSRYLDQSCQKNRLGSISLIADAFTQNELVYLKSQFKPDSVLATVQERLQLPRDIETYNDISKALSKLKRIPADIRKPGYNHPIEWKLLEGLGDTILSEIETDKGKLQLELYPAAAPGSVVNFLKLIKEDYFRDKAIHRVVPNFVIQTGCPRGDGYGGLDYSIRTEVHSDFTYNGAGMIGMASAGQDTECSQFFITFTATPHLDGQYTLFGKMTKGQDVLAVIQVGDLVKSVTISNKSNSTQPQNETNSTN